LGATRPPTNPEPAPPLKGCETPDFGAQLLGATRGSVTCTDARTGEIAWRKKGLHNGLNQVIALGDILIAALTLSGGNEEDELAQYAGFTITPQGLKPRWQLDPAVAGHWYHSNYPSFGHDGLLYVGRHPKIRQHEKMVPDDNLDEWLALDPATGEVRGSYLTDSAYRCHHVALVIRAVREAKGLTWYAVAKLAEIPNPNPATVRDIEYGRDAKLSNIEAVATALGLKLELVEQTFEWKDGKIYTRIGDAKS